MLWWHHGLFSRPKGDCYMKLRIAAVLAAVVMIAATGSVSAAPTIHMVRADSGAIAYTGYTANIQVRPLDYAVWIGGYVGSTFVQNGFAYIDEGDAPGLYAFSCSGACGSGAGGESWQLVTPTMYSWMTFQLTKVGTTWTFRYQDATGWHTQHALSSSASLTHFQIVVEYHNDGPLAFTTQAVQHAWVRSSTGAYVNTGMAWSADATHCPVERMRSTTPSNVVIESGSFIQPCYKVLW